ncbi:MAG: hypothetical protein ABIJ10_01910 [Candidatus Micrarchaeota archaeon]|nr:hypothetical protein [Candidatus Micrarchaeota archaeon]MBU1887344.1 hypothetical protein [Candidatus Micrarchaeota archaeon]
MDLTNKDFWNNFWVKFGDEIIALDAKNALSYDIPKEEQIRASLYSYLSNSSVLVELESDFRKDENSQINEIDLRILGDNKNYLVETKRAWALDGWYNKYGEYLADWKNDIEKLEIAAKQQTKQTLRCFFLTVFFDSNNLFERLKLNEINAYIMEKWGKETSKLELDQFKFGNKNCRDYLWVEM